VVFVIAAETAGSRCLSHPAGLQVITLNRGREVDDIETTVAHLRASGVVFEEYNLPGLKTVNGIARVDGNYPSRGGLGERAAWFRDSEGNLLGIGQPIR